MKSSLIKKLDKLWSAKIRERGHCEYCREVDNLNAHHIIARSKRATRWLLENGVCLCAKHHVFSSDMSPHLNPVEFIRWLERTKGVAFIESLRIKSRVIYKGDFEEIKKELMK